MPQFPDPQATGASGQSRAEWLTHLDRIGEDHGFFERVAPGHMALFVQESETLVVSFDTAERVFSEAPDGLPTGFAAVRKRQWSLLSIMASGETWFRSPDLFAFFDQLSDDGFFDSFSEVIFVGLGPMCAHAACVFSVAAPGAVVLVTEPVATLNPARAGFDHRFGQARALDFTSAYGYAPDLLGSARKAVLLFDPTDRDGAAHAAQFRGDNIIRVPLRWMSAEMTRIVRQDDLLMQFLRKLAKLRLGSRRVQAAIRDRAKTDAGYLWRLTAIAQSRGQFDRAAVIAGHGARVTEDARFADLAAQLDPGIGAETTT